MVYEFTFFLIHLYIILTLFTSQIFVLVLLESFINTLNQLH